jgi:glycosyltransferase 2 family protein
MRKSWVRYAVIFGLTAVFLFFFFRGVNWREVIRYLGGVNVPLFILSLLLVPLHLLTRSLRWRYLMIHEKPGVKLGNMFCANAVGFGVNFIFPGRIGEFVRPLYLAQKERCRKGFTMGTIVVERMFDIFTMCFLLGVFLVAKPLYASFYQVSAEAHANLRLWGIVGLAMASLILALSLALYFFRDKTLKVIGFFLRPLPHRFSGRILALFDDFIEGLRFFQDIKTLVFYTLSSFVVWLAIIFFYWVFFTSFRIRLPYFLLFPYVFLTMVGASVPTPGMVGGFHYFSKLGLTQLYGVDPNLALGATIVVHAIQILMTALIAYVIVWKEGISLFQIRKLGEDKQP